MCLKVVAYFIWLFSIFKAPKIVVPVNCVIAAISPRTPKYYVCHCVMWCSLPAAMHWNDVLWCRKFPVTWSLYLTVFYCWLVKVIVVIFQVMFDVVTHCFAWPQSLITHSCGLIEISVKPILVLCYTYRDGFNWYLYITSQSGNFQADQDVNTSCWMFFHRNDDCVYLLLNNVHFFFSQNSQEYERRVRAQALKFRDPSIASWMMTPTLLVSFCGRKLHQLHHTIKHKNQ